MLFQLFSRRAAAAATLLLLATLPPSLPAQARDSAPSAAAEIEKEDFFRVGIAPVRAPAGYDVTIVYFMDYQCPSCRRYTPDVARVLAEDPKIRMIYRDTPILSDMSTVAARAAIAAAFQGRHEAFHHALMLTKGQLSDAAIRAAADKAGIDWPRLQRDLKTRGDDINSQIGRNVELAVATGIMGTPAFIVGDRLSNGALDYAGLKAEIADARAAAGVKQAGSAPADEPPPTQNDTATTAKVAATAPAQPQAPIFAAATDRPDRAEPVAEGERQGWSTLAAGIAGLIIAAALAAGWWWSQRRTGSVDA